VGLDTVQAFDPGSAGVPVAHASLEGSHTTHASHNASAQEVTAPSRVLQGPEGGSKGPGDLLANQRSGALGQEEFAGLQQDSPQVLRSAGGPDGAGAGAGAEAGGAGAAVKQGSNKGGRDVLTHSRAFLARYVTARKAGRA